MNLGWQRATLSLKDFPLTFDDELNFSFKVSANQEILSINGQQSGKYIRALFGADDYFRLTEMPEANINYATFSKYSLIVLNGLTAPSTGLAQELKAYLKNGGSIVVFPNSNADQQIYSTFLTSINLPAVAQINTDAVKVSQIELQNRLFKDVFESLPKQIDLPQVNRYFTFTERSNSSKENLLQLPANKLFFAKYNLQNGSAYLCATDLNAENGNLAQHPVFVPLMYKIAFSSIKEQSIYYVVGKDNLLETAKIDIGTNQSLKIVADNFEVIPEVKRVNGKSQLYVADQIKKAGFYDVKKGDSLIAVMAFNDDRKESDMHYSGKADIDKIIDGKQVLFMDVRTDSLKSAIATKNNENDLWKLCLILSLVFLAVEILLIRFYTLKKQHTYEPSS